MDVALTHDLFFAGESRPDDRRILVVVHPGSACGSADHMLGEGASVARDVLAADLDAWHGEVIVLEGMLDDELAWREYRPYARAVSAVLARAEHAGRLGLSLPAEDPDQIKVMGALLDKHQWDPDHTFFDVTGAWTNEDDLSCGCVNSVAAVLVRRGYRCRIRPSALREVWE